MILTIYLVVPGGALNNEKIEKVNILGHVVMPILRQIAYMYLLFSIAATIVSSWYMVDWGIRRPLAIGRNRK